MVRPTQEMTTTQTVEQSFATQETYGLEAIERRRLALQEVCINLIKIHFKNGSLKKTSTSLTTPSLAGSIFAHVLSLVLVSSLMRTISLLSTWSLQ